ncbi:MAG: nucleotidyltransferase family protein [Methanobrevibacter sp.]|jgi:predicted nucleotidyltransferase|nr:nucleotidyltransferase family protein [Methanobrevibacter sp.]
MVEDELVPSEDFVKEIIKRDRKIFYKDLESSKKIYAPLEMESISHVKKSDVSKVKPLIADFTEYNPLHIGHHHCMKIAKSKIKDGIFVAIVPGLFERSGRGVPYIMTRQARAQAAIDVGADIVVEGPPMGIMGSGQYSLCLAKMFKALVTDFIPRGYRPFDGYNKILDRIAIGHTVVPKPYKIVDIDTGEILLEGKLEEDNYVIVSLSKSLNKVGFNFKDKFIFVKRITGVSGTLIRKSASSGNFNEVKNMLPHETIAILENEIANKRAPLHNSRYGESIIDSANKLSYEELINLNLIDEKTAKNLIEFRENKLFESLEEIQNSISQGFSTHFNQRVLSILEAKVNKDIISNYIDNYPNIIRVLNYKNEDTLEEFKNKLNDYNRRIELWQ